MTEYELSQILKERYENAKRNEAVVQVHLFGIDFAKEIKRNQYLVKQIVKAAGLGTAYATEVSKGIKLAQYVERKKEW